MLPAIVEYIDPAFGYQEIIADTFSAEEIDYVEEENSLDRFFTLWTRKEAFVKVTGLGLGDHLKLIPSLAGRHILHQSIPGADLNWQVLSFMETGNYMISIANGMVINKIRGFLII
ncbi:4'-phosphopantetheinyl transferase superfamily protein [Pedobacter metabolipauper]|uniref:4'-phosphopantetheinyl transferase superfamily protein n=1 Tax=Pedobacter metabolipauper TaxID=425513 RepID=UPI00105EA984|nr:4'-phosphopantetheinyl transferase superfamily protein [Pedobacter metabolipauper]